MTDQNLPSTEMKAEAPTVFDEKAFEHAQRVAKLYASSSLVPDIYKNNIPNCFIAGQMAQRLRVDTFTFMQHSAVVNGKPTMEGKLLIALINQSGLFTSDLEWDEGEDDRGKYAIAYAYKKSNPTKKLCARVDMAMAKAEGWTKNPKWTSMPEQMLRYRSGAFFGRSYVPQLAVGLPPLMEEVMDMGGGVSVVAERKQGKESDLSDLLRNSSDAEEVPA